MPTDRISSLPIPQISDPKLDHNYKNWNNSYHPILSKSSYQISLLQSILPRTVYFTCERYVVFFSRRIFLQNLLALLGGSPSPVEEVIITTIGSFSNLNYSGDVIVVCLVDLSLTCLSTSSKS